MSKPDFGSHGNTIRVRSGKYIDLVDPKEDQFDFSDIAGALSKICRFSGQTSEFYCPTQDQRVLTADLRWIPAGDLQQGQELLGFDETPFEIGTAGVRRRRYRPAIVIHNIPVKRDVWRLEMEDGSTVCSSAEHPWLVATKASRNQKWLTTLEIAEDLKDGKKRYMHRFFNPWETATGWEAGWLAGIYDGEGHFCFVDRRGSLLGVSQKEGLVLTKIKGVLSSLGFLDTTCSNTGSDNSGVKCIQMRGGWRESARLLGVIRPVRLLDKFKQGLASGVFAKQMDGKGAPLKIIKAYHEGEKYVAGIETSTRTYLCEGFGAHNSVAEHCCHCAFQAIQDGLSQEVCACTLLHDCSEAFMGDVVRPLKVLLPYYKELELRMERVIGNKFGLDFEKHAVAIKEIDNAMLIAEKNRLASNEDEDHMIGQVSGDTITWFGEREVRSLRPDIKCWTPPEAEVIFTAYARFLGVVDFSLMPVER